MAHKKIKIEKTLESEEIAAFLRLMASEIEGKGAVAMKDLGVDLHSFNKIKLGLIKKEGGNLTLTLKVKKDRPKNVAAGGKQKAFEDLAELKYRPLKKVLKATFAKMHKSIRAEALPTAFAVEDFMAQARAMVSYPGFGDDYYESFIASCNEFEKAFRKNDLAAVKEIFVKISELKTDCHKRYK